MIIGQPGTGSLGLNPSTKHRPHSRLLNNNMHLKEPKKSGRGGARPGSGRPKGTTDRVTVASLLAAIEDTNGRPYVEILAEDFALARQNDRGLTAKYHNLLANKLMNSLQTLEVIESADLVDAKAQAFQDAVAKLAQIADKTK